MDKRKLSVVIGVAAVAVAVGIGSYKYLSVRDTAPTPERHAGGGATSEGAKATAEAIETLKVLIDKDSPWAFHNFISEQYLRLPDRHDELTEELVAFLLDLWERRTGRHPGLNWANAGKDQFRLVVASSLLFAARASDSRYDTDEMRAYIRAKVRDDDELVSFFALAVLPLHGDASDIPVLKELATKPDHENFELAVRGLGILCLPDAERLLEDLTRAEKSVQRRRIIEHTLDKYYRSKAPNVFCSRTRASRDAADAAEPKRPAPPASVKEAEFVEKSIGKLKDLINRKDANGFSEYVAHWIPVRFYREKVPTKRMAGFYIELWEKRTDRHPELDWKAVGKDEFRFVLARTLMDMVRDGRLRYDTTEVRAYLRSIVAHDDEVVAGNALLALRVEGQESDIPLLKERASRSDLTEFKTAIRMLAGICGPKAKQALEELIKTERSDVRKRYIEETVRDFYDPKSRFFNCRI